MKSSHCQRKKYHKIFCHVIKHGSLPVKPMANMPLKPTLNCGTPLRHKLWVPPRKRRTHPAEHNWGKAMTYESLQLALRTGTNKGARPHENQQDGKHTKQQQPTSLHKLWHTAYWGRIQVSKVI